MMTWPDFSERPAGKRAGAEVKWLVMRSGDNFGSRSSRKFAGE